MQLNATVNCNSTLGSEEACEESQQALDSGSSDVPDPVSLARLASVAGIPDYSISLGMFDLGVYSNSTLQNETVPVSVNIMSGRGCDFVILDIIEALHKKGVIKTAKTGKSP